MKKLLLSLAIVLASTLSFAEGLTSDAARRAGFDTLTESQKAEVIKNIADAKARGEQNIAAQVSSPAKVNEWLDVGTKIGQMFGGAAKEVGIAVNDFVKTPVGQWTMAIIVWKYMGGAIIHVMGGLIVLTVGFGMILFMIRRHTTSITTYDPERKTIWGNPMKTSHKRDRLSGDAVGGYMCASALVILASIVCIFTY